MNHLNKPLLTLILVGLAGSAPGYSASGVKCSLLFLVGVACSGIGCNDKPPPVMEVPPVLPAPAALSEPYTATPSRPKTKPLDQFTDLRPLSEAAVGKNDSWASAISALLARSGLDGEGSWALATQIEIGILSFGGKSLRELKPEESEAVLLFGVQRYLVEPATQGRWAEAVSRAKLITPIFRDVFVEWDLFFDGLAELSSSNEARPSEPTAKNIAAHQLRVNAELEKKLKR